MPFPVAHSFTIASLLSIIDPRPFRATWTLLLVGIVLGNLPDIDFFFVWFLHWGADWHRGFSHSIIFAMLSGITAAFLFSHIGKSRFNWNLAILFFLFAESHTALDFFTTPRPNDGVELFFPFTQTRYAFDLFDYQTRYHWFFTHYARVINSRVLNLLFWVTIYESLIFGSIFAAARVISFALRRLLKSYYNGDSVWSFEE
jgi:membrane-bound metal-dependent hydrolase YbcI (DUF457 family)